jgi:AcrR family transcriptional regulator
MKKSEKTKRRILETAMKIFSNKGYNGTTTKEIAEAANLSEGTIFKYYKSKKNLLITGILEFLSKFGNKLFVKSIDEILEKSEDLSFKEILKRVIMNRKDLADEYADYLIVLLTEYKNQPEIQLLFKRKFEKDFKVIFDKLIKIGIKKNIITDKTNHYVFIRNMLGSFMIMIINHYYFDQWSSGLKFEEEVDLVIDQLINGLK